MVGVKFVDQDIGPQAGPAAVVRGAGQLAAVVAKHPNDGGIARGGGQGVGNGQIGVGKGAVTRHYKPEFCRCRNRDYSRQR